MTAEKDDAMVAGDFSSNWSNGCTDFSVEPEIIDPSKEPGVFAKEWSLEAVLKYGESFKAVNTGILRSDTASAKNERIRK
ncbi:hypothetical protein ACFUOZ_15270 [Paenarthrobacter sp. NPDC057355]|uniref:hypothetical protein n=1 Tax=Paenarthrobacter sp. NPDC057355 TaxID=3346105 RepID=UPI003634781F